MTDLSIPQESAILTLRVDHRNYLKRTALQWVNDIRWSMFSLGPLPELPMGVREDSRRCVIANCFRHHVPFTDVIVQPTLIEFWPNTMLINLRPRPTTRQPPHDVSDFIVGFDRGWYPELDMRAMHLEELKRYA